MEIGTDIKWICDTYFHYIINIIKITNINRYAHSIYMQIHMVMVQDVGKVHGSVLHVLKCKKMKD